MSAFVQLLLNENNLHFEIPSQTIRILVECLPLVRHDIYNAGEYTRQRHRQNIIHRGDR